MVFAILLFFISAMFFLGSVGAQATVFQQISSRILLTCSCLFFVGGAIICSVVQIGGKVVSEIKKQKEGAVIIPAQKDSTGNTALSHSPIKTDDIAGEGGKTGHADPQRGGWFGM